jgi:hypothetical protein
MYGTIMSPRHLSVLTERQVDEFMSDGCTMLRGAFARELVPSCQQLVWERIGLSQERPQEWPRPMAHLQEGLHEGPFANIWNQRLQGAFDDLLGHGRYHPVTHFGWWPVSFPGFAEPPWRPPVDGWHIDGIQFHHHLDSKDQGLLPIFLFSDIAPGDGGTAVALGSHRAAARILAAAEPAGLSLQDLIARMATRPRDRVVECTGEAGDVMLLHPFMMHARSDNVGDRVRFICNPCVGMHEPLRLGPGIADRTPLERSIVSTLVEPEPG